MDQQQATAGSDLFSGKVAVVDAVEQLRTRLLDLSSRNTLLHYKHPRGRCVQLAGAPQLDAVFEHLYVGGKPLTLQYVPLPSASGSTPPEAKTHAATLGLAVSFELPAPPAATASTPKDNGKATALQTLLYPAELERQLRQLAAQAKTAIEETGTNMLFLVLGFLEYYDSDDSERALLAPLLSLPVALTRGGVDNSSRTYTYQLAHNGEDVADNQTLKEKLRRDFMLSLPDFDEDDDTPERYLTSVTQAIQHQPRWRVRRQLTLGMLSFGKLALWADLDPKKHPHLLHHDLVQAVFSGGEHDGGHGPDGVFQAEDYRIDERPEAMQALIYNADSSQHSAIIDVLAGKNLVVNGPPGTGKSQTITNIIAAALARGKTVLFVSEKIAALEVVRRRLDQAGLGHFCLELHSHKGQKKKLLDDVAERLEQQFPAPPQFQAKLTTLQRQKTELARYAELMGSRIGNALGLTVHDVFWAAERRRQTLGESASEVQNLPLPEATHWNADALETRRTRLSGLAQLYDVIGPFDAHHPWWGFWPEPLAPGDDEAIARLVWEAHAHAQAAAQAASEAVAAFGLDDVPDLDQAHTVYQALQRVPAWPADFAGDLLSRLFDPHNDPQGRRSAELLTEVEQRMAHTQQLFQTAAEVLLPASHHPDGAPPPLPDAPLTPPPASLLTLPLEQAQTRVQALAQAVDACANAIALAQPTYSTIHRASAEAFLRSSEQLALYGLGIHPIQTLDDHAQAMLTTVQRLSEALERITQLAQRRGLAFDGSPAALDALATPSTLPQLVPGSAHDPKVLEQARRLAAFPLAHRTIADIDQIQRALHAEIERWHEALARLQQATQRLGLPFDATERAVEETAALARIAAAAPLGLLDDRHPGLAQPRAADWIAQVRQTLQSERETRIALNQTFWLDLLPPLPEVQTAIAALRREDNWLAKLNKDWRRARQLHARVCKEPRDVPTHQMAEELLQLAQWLELRDRFAFDPELRQQLGPLFHGWQTRPDALEQLHQWYQFAHTTLASCPGLGDTTPITTWPRERLAELAAQAPALQADAQQLMQADATVRQILGMNVAGFRQGRQQNWPEGLARLQKSVQTIANVGAFFARHADSSLSPQAVLALLETRADLASAEADLALLREGRQHLRDAAGDTLAPMADLATGPWPQALSALLTGATLVADTAAQARAFGCASAPLHMAEQFARTKLALDDAWSAITPYTPASAHCTHWDDWLALPRQEAIHAEQALRALLPRARPGVSAQQVLDALGEEAQAHTTLTVLAHTEGVAHVLGTHFAGRQTHIDHLQRLHTWGQAVCALPLPTPLRQGLLSAQAPDVLATAQRLYGLIDQGCHQAQQVLHGLGAYGRFEWAAWQHGTRAPADTDTPDRPSDLRDRLALALDAADSVLPWSKYLLTRQHAEQLGLQDFVEALEQRRLPATELATAFEFAAYQSMGRQIYKNHPELAQFDGFAHEKIREHYRHLDAEIITLTGQEFAHEIADHTQLPDGQRGTSASDYTELHLLRREMSKQRRHLPIRQLMKRAGRTLQALKPCFMMGPQSVAQYLEPGALEFDLVVMDEASQLRPEDALGAIARGSQLVVVGDPKQLPPTNFFERMLDDDLEDEDDASAITGMESILDICQQLFAPVRSLRWHYRSQHESLIAFSNHHFYKNLVIFPSPQDAGGELGVHYRHVADGVYQDRKNLREAEQVADAVLEHMLRHPDASLGVVALNRTQRDLLEELLDQKLRNFSEGAAFMARWEAEGWPFFVKNLENVQGDERDVIFISTTFGKAPGSQSVRQAFGPISRADGWRRLNVLFTRAKRRIELFTSMQPEDIVLDDKTPVGTRVLRDYLEFAQHGVLARTEVTQREPDSDFEIAVANVVRTLGYEVQPQLGVAGFFLDMAVRNPSRPGEFLAAIECDGATYHSGFSVRDRDRIRQEILESLGWRGKIHRIWSTDWFYNPRRETERLRQFLEQRRQDSLAAQQRQTTSTTETPSA